MKDCDFFLNMIKSHLFVTITKGESLLFGLFLEHNPVLSQKIIILLSYHCVMYFTRRRVESSTMELLYPTTLSNPSRPRMISANIKHSVDSFKIGQTLSQSNVLEPSHQVSGVRTQPNDSVGPGPPSGRRQEEALPQGGPGAA